MEKTLNGTEGRYYLTVEERNKRLKECNKEKRKKVETVSKENCMNLKKN